MANDHPELTPEQLDRAVPRHGLRRYLNHVTLNTGHGRKSYRDEVDNQVIDICRDLLDDMLDQPQVHTVVPMIEPQCTITGTAQGPALIATVWTPPVEVRGMGPQRAPLVTLGVATRSKSGAKLWSLLHQMHPELKTFGQPAPGEPWVAARLEVGVALLREEMQDLMMTLADFERCLGWAWIESAEARRAVER